VLVCGYVSYMFCFILIGEWPFVKHLFTAPCYKQLHFSAGCLHCSGQNKGITAKWTEQQEVMSVVSKTKWMYFDEFGHLWMVPSIARRSEGARFEIRSQKAQFEHFFIFFILKIKRARAILAGETGMIASFVFFRWLKCDWCSEQVLEQWAAVSRNLSTGFLLSGDMMRCGPVFSLCRAWRGKGSDGMEPSLFAPSLFFPPLPSILEKLKWIVEKYVKTENWTIMIWR